MTRINQVQLPLIPYTYHNDNSDTDLTVANAVSTLQETYVGLSLRDFSALKRLNRKRRLALISTGVVTDGGYSNPVTVSWTSVVVQG